MWIYIFTENIYIYIYILFYICMLAVRGESTGNSAVTGTARRRKKNAKVFDIDFRNGRQFSYYFISSF